MVKVISWRSGTPSSGTSQFSDKVTSKEWNIYCDHIIRQHPPDNKQKALDRLAQIKKAIISHGGLK